MERKQYNWWDIPKNTEYPDPSFNNGFGSTSTQNTFKGVNIVSIESSFNLPYRLRMPDSVRLMTITGSETFIGNAVFDPANVALILKVKEQIENNIFTHENDPILNLQYVESVNPAPTPFVANYGTGYSMWDTNAAAFDAITRASARVVSFFKDIGVDITSELITPIRFRDIFMSAYVLSLQIIIMYNAKIVDDAKAEQLKKMKTQVKDKTTCDNIVVNPNPDNPFVMPDTDIASEHKPLFEGINPDDNGESVIDFPKESDSLSDLFDRMSMSESEVVKPHYPWEKDDDE